MSADKSEQNELKRVVSYQWPSGHVGHITEGQKTALERFKTLCKEKGYYNPGDDKQPPTHDDETLLRYLRARKFIPQEAFGQFKETEDWRQQNEIDNLYETIDINEFEHTRLGYPQWIGRRDKRGIPVYVFEVAQISAKGIDVYQTGKVRKGSDQDSGSPSIPNVSRKLLCLFALYENLCRFVLPLCAALPNRPNPETPISQSNNIVDISKVGLKQFWNLRAHMQDASKLATAHYPETLDRIFIVGAPSFFPTVWEWIKKWFDPITVSKIFILNSTNMKSTLQQFIDPDNIPKKYGGNLEWNSGDMPALDPVIADNMQWKEEIMQNGHRTLPIGPIKWQYGPDGELVAVAIGTENGQQRHQVLGALHPQAGVARLALSPGRVQETTSNNGINNGKEAIAVADKQATNGTTSSTMDAASKENQQSTSSQTEPFSVPYRDHANDVHAPPLDSRQGTSESRYEQQAATHAHGQLEHGTPSVQTDGQGVEHTVVEPRTVGQAPKETKLYGDQQDQQTQASSSVVEQVQQTASQVASQVQQIPGTVMNAVGMGGSKNEKVDDQVEAKEEERKGVAEGKHGVHALEPKMVEEFLREQHMSKPEHQRIE